MAVKQTECLVDVRRARKYAINTDVINRLDRIDPMKISQTKIIPSDRIKCVHRYNNYIVCGLFTGSLLFVSDNQVKKRITIGDTAIRALASTTNLLVGTDGGEIVVLDPSLRRIRNIKMHNDFIRKIRAYKEYIFTCSDDFTIKKMKDEEIHVLKGHEHFVMDIRVVDDDRILSCSLDATLKLWNYRTNILLMTFKGHTKGINAIDVYKDTFYSVGDDYCLRIWNNNVCRIKEGVSDKNIDHVSVNDDLIVTGAEDGYYKIYKRCGEQLEHSLFIGSRIWDSLIEDNAFYIASDSGLLIYEREDAKVDCYLVDRGLLSITNRVVFLNGKEIGRIAFDVENVTYSSKLMCLQKKNGFHVYSYLGFREKMKGDGRAVVNDDGIFVFEDNAMKVYVDFEQTSRFGVPYDNFRVCDRYIINYGNSGFVIYDFAGVEVSRCAVDVENIFVIAKKIVVSTNCIQMCSIDSTRDMAKKVAMEKIVDTPIERGYVYDNVLYFVSRDKLYYMLDNGFYSMIMYVNDRFLGIQNNNLAFYDKKMVLKPIDPIIAWQCESNKTSLLEGREKECVDYLLKQKEFDLALSLSDAKFPIYLQMNRFKDAFLAAKNRAEYETLGKLLMKKCKFAKAARAFKASGNAEMLFICDFLGKRKFMNENKNDIFMKSVYLRDKNGLKKFLAGTEYERALEKYY